MKKAFIKNKKILSLVLFFLYVGLALLAAQSSPRVYIAKRSLEPLKIDGKANEVSWEKAQWSDAFIDIEGTKQPRYHTAIKMLWDANNFYFFAQLEEPHVWATLKRRDTVIFYNNDLEIFIDPDGDTHNYYEFEMNALNTVWDLFLTKPYRNHGKVLDSWDIQGLKTAVNVDGTINDPTDQDVGWSVEIAIPWTVITEASKNNTPPENNYWRINFSRVNWDFDLTNNRYSRKRGADGKHLSEYNWVWSPQGVINMHEPEHWGYVYFSDEAVGSQVEFTIPKDEHVKWRLYEIYRDMIDENKRKIKWKAADGETYGDPIKVLGKSFIPVLESHKSGFNIWTTSPFTKKRLVIRDDGKFYSYDK